MRWFSDHFYRGAGCRVSGVARRASNGLMAIAFVVLLVVTQPAFSQRRPVAQSSIPALLVTSEPGAIVWIDEIRRGTTNESGQLQVKKVLPGRHVVRVRAAGFREATVPLLPGRRSLNVKLVKTSDTAELRFQQAEAARDKARDDPAKEAAAELYRETLKLRPAFPAAHLGLARLLLDLNKTQEALTEIQAARRNRPAYAEASAVEGRIHREAGFTDDAILSFRRAIREAKGFQPEAYVGLARVFEEQGKHDEAIDAFNKALAQLSESEPVIYQLVGAVYEKQQKFKEAVAAYEKYLALAPNGSLAPAIRSILDQLKREAEGNQIIP
ncbi:MAG TPA: tetratricopeptide repeat protein [Pyrinomonadaceae bacterium]|nr:tetratricopeptide repeat protein [Pyrinomonadaceae bacterium]